MKPRTVMTRIAVVLAAAALLSVTAAAQRGKPAAGPTPIRVDGKIIKSYIEWLAAPEREGRRTLTPGYEKSVEWAAAKFKEWGVKPAGENGTYLQDVTIRGTYTATTGIPELNVDGRPFFMKDGDFALDNRSTPGAAVSGEVVFVGYGISAPAKGLDEYAGVDVKGKIVLALKGSPKDAPPARGMFGAAPPEAPSTEAWAEESSVVTKILKAYEKGAAAILLFDPARLSATQAAGSLPGGVSGGIVGGPAPQLDPSSFTRPFLAFSDVDVRVFRQIMYRDPQESPRGFSSRIDQVRRDIKGKKACSAATGVRAQAKGYAAATYYNEKNKNVTSHNVIGKVEGTDPKLKTQYIVVGGHMDHLGVNTGIIYPGADDDASGTATVMEMARLVAANAASIKPKRTIIFALWCGEEEGLLGSNYWGEHPTDGAAMDNVVVNFNNDMVGLGDGIGAPGALNFPAMFDVVMKNQDPDVAKAVHPSTAGPGGSDYSVFIEKGVESFALMTDGGIGHPDYHDAGDRADRIDAEMLRKNGQFVLQGIINVANDTTTTMPIPDRQHLYNGMRLTLLNMNQLRTSSSGYAVVNGVVVPIGGRRAGLAPAIDSWALAGTGPSAGSTASIDIAAKLLNLGRVDVALDSVWFGQTVTDRGKDAIKAFEANGIVLNLVNPPKALILDVAANAKKPFIISGLAVMPDAELMQQIKAKNLLLAVEFDAGNPQGVAATLIELKKLAGDSGNLLLTTRGMTPVMRAATPPAMATRMSALEEARQQLYVALIKAGWTRDEINAMVGVSPRPAPGAPAAMPALAGPAAGFSRMGNLAKLDAGGPTS